MSDDDLRQFIRAIKETQASEFDALHAKLDALLTSRDRVTEQVDAMENRVASAEVAWLNTLRDQARRIDLLEARLTKLEA